MWEFLNSILSKLGMRSIGVSISIPLPSFCNDVNDPKEDGMRPSDASDFDTDLIKGVTTSRDFKLCHMELVRRFIRLSTAFSERNPGKSLLVTCTYRSQDEQRRLFTQGRFGNPGKIITRCDGFNNLSNHNKFPARAVDVAIIDGGKTCWDEEHYYPLGALAKEFGLVWGGDWVGFADYPHLELPKDVA